MFKVQKDRYHLKKELYIFKSRLKIKKDIT